jgi:uncharacterized membrane protein YgdD (TMEM256/DUF423 family)
MINKKPILLILIVLLGTFVSVPALAHSGEHNLSFWSAINHILTSPMHCLALIVLSLVLSLAKLVWRRKKLSSLSNSTC